MAAFNFFDRSPRASARHEAYEVIDRVFLLGIHALREDAFGTLFDVEFPPAFK